MELPKEVWKWPYRAFTRYKRQAIHDGELSKAGPWPSFGACQRAETMVREIYKEVSNDR